MFCLLVSGNGFGNHVARMDSRARPWPPAHRLLGRNQRAFEFADEQSVTIMINTPITPCPGPTPSLLTKHPGCCNSGEATTVSTSLAGERIVTMAVMVASSLPDLPDSLIHR